MLGSRQGGCFFPADVRLILSRANACSVLEVGDKASLGRLHIMSVWWGKQPQPFSWICYSYTICSAPHSLFQREHQKQNSPLRVLGPVRSCQGVLVVQVCGTGKSHAPFVPLHCQHDRGPRPADRWGVGAR